MNKAPLAVLCAVLASHAGAATYEMDPAHSSVSFKIRHLAAKVPGTFEEFSGSFEFDEKAPEASKVEALIQAASINTGNKKRDNHLRSADFFDVEKHPTAAFKSTKVRKTGKNRYRVDGLLSLHGIEKPVTLDVEYGGEMGAKAGFSATGKINRKDFGIVWNKALDKGSFVLGDEVSLSIEVEAQKKG